MDDMIKAMCDQIGGMSLLTDVVDILNINPQTETGYTEAWKVVETLYNAIQPLATMMLFIFFMLAVIDKLTDEHFTLNTFLRQVAMLLIAKGLMEHGLELTQYIYSAGLSLLELIGADSIKNITSQSATLQKLVDNYIGDTWGIKLLRSIYTFIILLFPYLASLVIEILVKVLCYSRLIEIYLRFIFTPVALADFYHSGLHSTGWRYIKNFFAIAIQGGIILAIAVIYSALYQGVFGAMLKDDMGLMSFIGLYFAFAVSAVMLMFKSLGFAKELMGTA